MKRSFGAYPLALFAMLAFVPALITSCSNPSSAPTASSSAAYYSASAFFNTESLGDTSTTPFPFCFPAQYLQQKLGLTDSQVLSIQNIQDSLRIALQTQLNAMKSAGNVNPDSVRNLRLEYQTYLYEDIAGVLTATQLAELQALTPPFGPPYQFRRFPFPPPNPRGHKDSARYADTTHPSSAVRDSLALNKLEQVLAAAGDTLTVNQISLIQNLQASLNADTTLTPQGRKAEFEAQVYTILTAKQLTVLRNLAEGDSWHRPRRR